MKYLFLCLFLFVSISISSGQDFYDWDKVREIRLDFDKPNWADILGRMKNQESEQRLSAKLTIDGKQYESEVGVRFKGNSSYKNTSKGGAKKLPFNIKIDYKQKNQKHEDGYETIKLSNGFRDPSFVREILSYEIARKYMPASQSNFAKLYINGEYVGLYSNTESVDDEFLKNHFGEKKGVLIKCDPEWTAKEAKNCPEGDKSSLMYLGENPQCYFPDYEIKSDTGWQSLIWLTKILKDAPEKIAGAINVDQTLWMHAFNNVLVNLDSYTGRLSHNYYLYRDSAGCFQPIVWDMNLSFGGFRFDGNGTPLTNEEMITFSPLVHFKNRNPKRPLLVNLLNNSLWRKIYLAHMRTIVEENFSNGEFKNRCAELEKFIENEVKNDPNKLYGFDDFKKNFNETVKVEGAEIIGLNELMDARVEYLKNHPLLAAESPRIDSVNHYQFGNTLAIQATVSGAEKVWAYYRYNPKDVFQLIELKDDSRHNDQLASDNVWGATLNFLPGTQYYVVAENEKAASLLPERASYEFFKVEAPKEQ